MVPEVIHGLPVPGIMRILIYIRTLWFVETLSMMSVPFIFSETKQSAWKGGAWNITFENNTLVNWNTRAAGNIFNMRNIPDGSTYTVKIT